LRPTQDYDGDVEALSLVFAVTSNDYGEARQIPLIDGGADRPVTAANRILYVHSLAHYKLNVMTARQCAAFLRGFRDLVCQSQRHATPRLCLKQIPVRNCIGSVPKRLQFTLNATVAGMFAHAHPDPARVAAHVRPRRA
jgi:hypothetical protein